MIFLQYKHKIVLFLLKNMKSIIQILENVVYYCAYEKHETLECFMIISKVSANFFNILFAISVKQRDCPIQLPRNTEQDYVGQMDLLIP